MSGRSILLALMLFAGVGLPDGLYGQEDDDEDALPPGLSATYSAADRAVTIQAAVKQVQAGQT